MAAHKLETNLLQFVPIILESRQHELDLLAMILSGQLGTPSQRAAIIRIIKELQTPTTVTKKLLKNLDNDLALQFLNRTNTT